MAREGMNRDHQESEARCQQSSTAEGPVAYADLNVICAPPSEKNKSMNGKMMKTKNDFSSSSSSSDEEKRVKNLGNPSVRAAANDDASLPSSSSSSLIFGSSQEFLRRSECLSSTSLDMSSCSSHGITVPSFEASFCGKPSSDNMFGLPMPQEPDVRADILCSEFSDTSGTTASSSGLSYDVESSSFDDIAHVPQAHDACIAPDSFNTVCQGHSITNPLCELKKKSSSDNGFFLSQKPDVRSAIPPQKPGPARCLCCRKKLGLLGFKCRCGDLFCALHRYSDKHNCRFDYRTAAKEAIAKANPVVKAPKIWKL